MFSVLNGQRRDTIFLVSGCISVYLPPREPALARRKTRMFAIVKLRPCTLEICAKTRLMPENVRYPPLGNGTFFKILLHGSRVSAPKTQAGASTLKIDARFVPENARKCPIMPENSRSMPDRKEAPDLHPGLRGADNSEHRWGAAIDRAMLT